MIRLPRVLTSPQLAFAGLALFAGLSVSANTYFWDSGELTTTLATGSIAHPSGFPAIHAASGWLAFLPFGPMALRISLLSCLSALAACGFAWLAVTRLLPQVAEANGPRRTAAAFVWMFVSVAFLLSDTPSLHFVHVEIYMPSLAIVSAALFVACDGLANITQRRHIISLAALCSLALTVHSSTFLIITAVFLFVLAAFSFRKGLRKAAMEVFPALLPALVLAGLAGFGLLYLPIRSLAEPPVNWGDPSSWSGFVRHVTGATIREAYSAEMLQTSALALAENATRYARQIGEQAGWTALLGLAGLAVLMVRRTSVGLLLLTIIMIDAFFSIMMNPMAQVEQQTSLTTFFLIHLSALYLILQLIARPGLDGPQWGRVVLSVTAGVVIAVLAMFSMPVDSRHWRTAPHANTYALMGLNTTEPGGLVVTGSDELSGTTMYFRHLEGRRPDTIHLVRQMACEDWLTLPASRHGLADTGELVATSFSDSCVDYSWNSVVTFWGTLLGRLSDSGIGGTWDPGAGPAIEPMLAEALRPGFPTLTFGIHAQGRQPDVAAWLEPAVAFLQQHVAGTRPDPLSGRVLSHRMRLLASFVLTNVPTRSAEELESVCHLLRIAVELSPETCESRNNLAACLLMQGKPTEALEQAVAASNECPQYVPARVNAIRCLLLTNRLAEAEAALSSLTAELPSDQTSNRLKRLHMELVSTNNNSAAFIVEKYIP